MIAEPAPPKRPRPSEARPSRLGALPYLTAALFPALLVAAVVGAASWFGGQIGQMRRELEVVRQQHDDRLDAREKELKARIDDLARLVKPAPKAPETPSAVEAKPPDLLLAVLHSKKVSYNRDCLAAVVKFCQASSPARRVAVTAVVGDKVYDPVIQFGDDVRSRGENAFNLNLPLDHASENTDHAVGEGLAKLLKAAERPARLILIASTRCPAPDTGWKGMEDVRIDAVLIQPWAADNKDAPPALAERAAGWPAYCGRAGGACHALWRRGDAGSMAESLLAKLREIARP